MKINMTFKAKAICKVYDKSDNTKGPDNRTLDIEMDAHTAANFLFKFTPYAFEMGEYKVLINHDGLNNIKGISFHKDDDLIIVANQNQFLSEVLEGYERITVIERLSSMMEFSAFSSSNEDNDEVLDEFDDNIKMD